MGRFLMVLRVPNDYTPGDPATGAALASWLEGMGSDLVDPGHIVLEAGSVGDVGASTRAGGYLVVTAEDLDAALAVVKGCPFVGLGGGIEVGLTPERPPTLTAQ